MRTEAGLQAEIVITLKLLALDRSLPERRSKLLMCYHIPNGEANGIRGAKAKRMGVRKGMPDLHLPVAGYVRWAERLPGLKGVAINEEQRHSLYLEVKLPGVRVPDYQQAIHEELRQEGNRVEVVRSVHEAILVCKEHLSL